MGFDQIQELCANTVDHTVNQWSLILFLAEYDAGDIAIDHKEIIEADWFSFNALPTTPSKETISGRLISLSLA